MQLHMLDMELHNDSNCSDWNCLNESDLELSCFEMAVSMYFHSSCYYGLNGYGYGGCFDYDDLKEMLNCLTIRRSCH